MATVNQRFHGFISNLELTDAERTTASAQQNRVRDLLRMEFTTTRDFITGSYGRRTAIRPLHDIDIFVVMQNPPATPKDAIAEVFNALRRRYPQTSLRRQARSVNIDFAGTGIGFDIIPARTPRSGDYEIPDRGADRWITTNPEKHRDVLVAANQRAGGMLNPLIKALKQWNGQYGKPLKSFHLEVMCYDAFPHRGPDNYRVGIQSLLSHLQQKIVYSCPDPAGVGLDIDTQMTSSERGKAKNHLNGAYETACRAVEAESYDPNAAHRHWGHLFGDKY